MTSVGLSLTAGEERGGLGLSTDPGVLRSLLRGPMLAKLLDALLKRKFGGGGQIGGL